MKEKMILLFKNIAAILIILALLIIIFYQNRYRDVFKFKNTLKSGSKENEYTQNNLVEGYTDGNVFPLQDDVLFVSSNLYAVINSDGDVEKKIINSVSPVAYTSGNYVIYYSKDSKEAAVCKNERECFSIKLKNRILLAKINQNGYSITVTEKEGYSCEIMLHNNMGEAIFKWDLSESELIDADLSMDNKKLVLSVVCENSKELMGQIIQIDTSSAEVISKKNFKSEIFYNVKYYKNSTFSAVGSNKLVYFNADGSVKWKYGYSERTLIKFDSTYNDLISLAFISPGSEIKGNSTEVEIVDRLGKCIGNKTFTGLADNINSNGESIALSIGKNIYVFNRKIEDVKKIKSDYTVKKAVLFDNTDYVFALGNSGGEIKK